MLKKLSQVTAYALLALVLMSADRHLQTSAQPNIQLIQIKLPDENLDLYLNAPSVHYEKRLDGTLSFLKFQHTTSYYRITFHEHDPVSQVERPALVQRFRVFEGEMLLHGMSQKIDTEGNVICEQNWDQGRLHGPQKIFDANLQLREVKNYQYGIPVGKWQSFFADGTLASETQLPANYEEWQKTFSPGYEEDSKSIMLKSYHHPVLVTRTSYCQEGCKQIESKSWAHLTATGFLINDPHESKVYNKYGKVCHHIRYEKGLRKDTLVVENYGSQATTTRTYVNDKLFKATTWNKALGH